ncbi:hypothetical protein [Streptomyces sp. NPDC101393]|uniref:hypothetical protein n=1 Tax=Streptomyces sp. NPDC101393 TaxID=3366141 RepID=UPI0037F439B7
MPIVGPTLPLPTPDVRAAFRADARADARRDPQETSPSPGGHRGDAATLPLAVNEPAASAAALPPAVRSAAPPERVVQVHIGAIEIHGTPPAEAPGPAPTAPEPLGDRPAAGSSAGFEDFVGLRSYAPWGR